jgi:hypothetical protein
LWKRGDNPFPQPGFIVEAPLFKGVNSLRRSLSSSSVMT